ncbi:assimilatory sulfite reductase (NADPH) flavoprotein subunit [Paenibacillus sp. FSL H8-0457]|uniref:assimilatory sulfite reductase (NADPH) flavoprotein subunit n=1 Tax=unclassified Paenibacillus TaxID=185978 RepID=UPI0003E29696|nr:MULTISPECIES: assimilatory sulfite reductase (NADPH) flavoprotein subunit [unclassified Paenibacillus]ETT67203.1 sulfite reductase (NADPH) flavoprotein, alpha chain [Paenibacillus sp. FSL H8-457]
MELQVTNSPFNQEQVELLNRLLPTLTESQRTWLSGFIAALQGTAAAAAVAASPQASAAAAVSAPVVSAPKEVTVLYGSQTGNGHGLSKKLSKKLEEVGLQVTMSSMSDFKPNNLKKLQNLLIIVSTHGEGEPPDNAIPFYEFLHSKRAPQVENLQYSVLALGDTSYEFFCQTGKDFDKRLEELGGKRLTPRVDCDVDFDESAAEWMNQVLLSLNEAGAGSSAVEHVSAVALTDSTESEYSRSNPFQAEILENLNLNGRGSDRETRHIEISLEGSNLQYEPGDSLGIYPENHPQLVDDLIAGMGWNADEAVVVNKSGEARTLRDALLRHYEITVLTKPLIEQAAKLSGSEGLRKLLEPGHEQELRAYIEERDLLDLVQDYGLQQVAASDFVSILRKIPARLYSIASSSKAFPDEVHVTVRTVRYEAHGRNRYGVCSVQLAERLEAGDSLPVYIQHNPNFKLPENPDTPIIMIGPGTGVAPFRAFLGEREETGAEGKSWLFYGDQHFTTDFLYQIEWQRWLKDGVLTRMDVAFSRDTDKKVYVQHRMLENSKELYQWLQEGACVYVCGDEKKMAHDVHSALGSILEQEGGMSPEEAAEYLTLMQQQKRYQRDVY